MKGEERSSVLMTWSEEMLTTEGITAWAIDAYPSPAAGAADGAPDPAGDACLEAGVAPAVFGLAGAAAGAAARARIRVASGRTTRSARPRPVTSPRTSTASRAVGC